MTEVAECGNHLSQLDALREGHYTIQTLNKTMPNERKNVT